MADVYSGISVSLNEFNKWLTKGGNMRRFFLIFTSLAFFGIVLGESPDELILQGKRMIKDANSQWNQEEMLTARSFFENISDLDSRKWLLDYYIAYCDYRLMNYAFSKNDKKAVERFVDHGIEKLEEYMELKTGSSDAHALLSSFYGSKISLDPQLGPRLGSLSNSAMTKALERGAENPRVHLIRGISYYYTPEQWGGGKDKALASLKESVRLYAQEKTEPIMPDWGHSEAYGWLGRVEMDLGNQETARAHYQKALEIDPSNTWVKNILLPRLEKEDSLGKDSK
jgi:tetratricopeptide (TPR) repeat protein